VSVKAAPGSGSSIEGKASSRHAQGLWLTTTFSASGADRG
jgi:hypothetical protein